MVVEKIAFIEEAVQGSSVTLKKNANKREKWQEVESDPVPVWTVVEGK